MRVYQLAQELGLSSKDLIGLLASIGVDVKGHMSALDEDIIARVRNPKLKSKAKEPAAKGAPKEKKVVKATEEPKTVEEPKKATESQKTAEVKDVKKDKAVKPQQDESKKNVEVSRAATLAKPVEVKAEVKDVKHVDVAHKPKKDKPLHKILQEDEEESLGLPTVVPIKPKTPKEEKKIHIKIEPHHVPAPAPAKPVAQEEIKEIELKFPITVGALAEKIHVKANALIKNLMDKKIFASINQEVTKELVEDLLLDYGYLLKEKKKTVAEEQKPLESLLEDTPDDPKDLKPRAPIVTMMGHVDHGKTSLLDAIRSAKVVASEAGGITQHIGAYELQTAHGRVVFVDTPGHAAFTAMRARGANVTDVVVLVVAADDGVMPQTVEAIHHAQAANVPIIVAVNKIDKPGAQPAQVRSQLTEHQLVSEEWGGKTIFVNVSAHTKAGIPDLLDTIILEAEMLELKANPHKKASGVILEANLDKGRGPVATLMIMNGTLKIGDIVVAGNTYGKVRALLNDKGERLKEAAPATPVAVLGLSSVPSAGDKFIVVPSEKEARAYQDKIVAQERETQLLPSRKAMSLDDLYSQISRGEIKELNMILKTDNTGSLEALADSLQKLSTAQVELKIVHQGIGTISETDIILAKASGAIVIGFHVNMDMKAKQAADKEGVDVHIYEIIYQAIDEVKKAMEGILDTKDVEKRIGRVEVRAIFKSSKIGSIAGSYVLEGKITRNALIRVMRDGKMIHEGKIGTLRRGKDDVREVAEGYECGIVLEKFEDFQDRDVFEAFVIEKEKQYLA